MVCEGWRDSIVKSCPGGGGRTLTCRSMWWTSVPLVKVSLAQFGPPTALLVETSIVVVLIELESNLTGEGSPEAGSREELLESDVIEICPWNELTLEILTGKAASLPSVAFWTVIDGVTTKSGVVGTSWLT